MALVKKTLIKDLLGMVIPNKRDIQYASKIKNNGSIVRI